MQEAWNRIQAWCEIYAPEILDGLNPGATKEELDRAEADLGVTFPADLRELYSLHNGQKNERSAGLLDGEEFLSLSRMRDEWTIWKQLWDAGKFEGIPCEPPPGIQADWWNPGWIPITQDGGGDHWCIDTAPTSEGTIGQVIRMLKDDERAFAASSLREWLMDLADQLESGDYIFSTEEYFGLVPREDISEEEEWRGVDNSTRRNTETEVLD